MTIKPLDSSKAVEPSNDLVLTFSGKNVVIAKSTDGSPDSITVTVKNMIEFLTEAVMKEEILKGFLDDSGTKRFLAKAIGVPGMLANYDKNEVLTNVSWDYVKSFFLDHINHADILNHIGWEEVKAHFADKLQAEIGSRNDINTAGKSVLEALNDESEGQNP